MNTIDFTETYYIDRRGSHSRQWDGEHLKFSRTDLLPLCRLSAYKRLFVPM